MNTYTKEFKEQVVKEIKEVGSVSSVWKTNENKDFCNSHCAPALAALATTGYFCSGKPITVEEVEKQWGKTELNTETFRKKVSLPSPSWKIKTRKPNK